MVSYLRHVLQFNNRALRQLCWHERQCLIHTAGRTVRRHLCYWIMIPLLGLFANLTVILAFVPLAIDRLHQDVLRLLWFALFILVATMIVWYFIRFQQVLQQKLLNAGIRPTVCFKCGYELDGYEGSTCPACNALLPRQADPPPEST
jgi:hypothetical protein